MATKQAEPTDKAKPIYGRGSLQLDIIQMAGVVSARTGEDLQEIYDRHIRPGLTKEFKQVVSKMNHDIGGEG